MEVICESALRNFISSNVVIKVIKDIVVVEDVFAIICTEVPAI